MSGGRDPHSRQFLFVGSTVVRCFCDPDDQKEIKRKKNETKSKANVKCALFHRRRAGRRRPPTGRYRRRSDLESDEDRRPIGMDFPIQSPSFDS